MPTAGCKRLAFLCIIKHMKKNIFIVVALVVLTAVVGWFAYSSYLTKTSTPQVEIPEESVEAEEDGELTNQYTISIEDYAYSPQELTISVGETVVWTNNDKVRHDVASDEGSELAGPLLNQNESYSHTFNEPGVYPYHCTPHPFMTATIIVQ